LSDLDRHRPTASRPGLQPLLKLALLASVAAALALVGCGGGEAPPQRPVTYADHVVVKKSQRRLQLMKNGQVLREYRVALGDNPYGHKMQEGDERTPEGTYILDWRNPNSQYHKAIHISYPNEQDRAVAEALGVQPGGMIMLHGLPNGVRSPSVRAEYQRRDWTNGCIAVQDHEIDEIWRLVRDGTPIRIGD
jgi:murein L,D-transpeptidase YafK